MWRRSSLLKTQFMQLRKEGLTRKIQACRDAIPVQCSNQHVLYCYRTVSNISHVLRILSCILTLPLHIYSVRIQNTFSKNFFSKIRPVAYIKKEKSKRAVKLANANINRACFDTEVRRNATLDHAQIQLYRYQQKQKLWATLRITVSSRIPSNQTLYGNFP